MAYKVVIPQDITEVGKEYLRERGYEVVVGTGATDAQSMKSILRDADALLARTAPYPADVLAAAEKLKVIGRHGIGVDNIDVDYCTQHGIYVTFAPTSNAISVAEHTVGFMLSLAHHFTYFDSAVRSGKWEVRNSRKGCDLEGKVLGVIGLGRIGTQVANKCMAAFQMKVIGYDALLPHEKYPEGVHPANVEEIFSQADFVTLHVPATPETRGMVNAELLAKMKPTAYLINCARGELVNEADLCQALKNKQIAGAATDVFASEPPASDSELLKLDNLSITPHSAALTQESMDRMGLHAAMGIHSVLSGEKPQWCVNQPLQK